MHGNNKISDIIIVVTNCGYFILVRLYVQIDVDTIVVDESNRDYFFSQDQNEKMI